MEIVIRIIPDSPASGSKKCGCGKTPVSLAIAGDEVGTGGGGVVPPCLNDGASYTLKCFNGVFDWARD